MLYLAAIAFELCVANRYKLNKAYEKLKAKSAAKPDDLTLRTQCLQAEVSSQVAYGISYTNFLCCSAYSSTCSRVELTHCNLLDFFIYLIFLNLVYRHLYRCLYL